MALRAASRVRCCTFAWRCEREWMGAWFGHDQSTYIYTHPADHVHIEYVCVMLTENGTFSLLFRLLGKRVKVVVVFLRLPQFHNWYVTIHILIFQQALHSRYTQICPVQHASICEDTLADSRQNVFFLHTLFAINFRVSHFFFLPSFLPRIFGVSCESHRETRWIYCSRYRFFVSFKFYIFSIFFVPLARNFGSAVWLLFFDKYIFYVSTHSI